MKPGGFGTFGPVSKPPLVITLPSQGAPAAAHAVATRPVANKIAHPNPSALGAVAIAVNILDLPVTVLLQYHIK
jgi:hypothetical protein